MVDPRIYDEVGSFALAGFDESGRTITWDGGGPIAVGLDPRNMGYAEFVPDAHQAIKRINLVGGFKLRLVTHDGSRLDESDIAIRWVQKRSGLHDSADDLSSATAQLATARSAGQVRIIGAEIRLLADKGRRPGFAPGSWGAVLLHELLHALGAGHVSDPGQIMHSTTGSVGDLGAGDCYILKLLAAAADDRRSAVDA